MYNILNSDELREMNDGKPVECNHGFDYQDAEEELSTYMGYLEISKAEKKGLSEFVMKLVKVAESDAFDCGFDWGVKYARGKMK